MAKKGREREKKKSPTDTNIRVRRLEISLCSKLWVPIVPHLIERLDFVGAQLVLFSSVFDLYSRCPFQRTCCYDCGRLEPADQFYLASRHISNVFVPPRKTMEKKHNDTL